MRIRILTIIAILSGLAVYGPVLASVQTDARAALNGIYQQRPDLQKFFDVEGKAVVGSPYSKVLPDLETWARRYGWREFSEELVWYAPGPSILAERKAVLQPVRSTKTIFPSSTVTASSWMVIDDATRKTLLEMGPRTPHPLASITKLMTAMTALDKGLEMQERFAVVQKDFVGGATLKAPVGTTYTVRDLFDAMLVGSANNAANAVARASGEDMVDFIADMNAHAEKLGLTDTVFVDPTGIEPENMSSARDIAALGLKAFDLAEIRRATTTPLATLTSGPSLHTIKNTNGLLVNAKNGLTVLGGKTGYLEESQWNLVVKLKDATHQPVLVVVLGSDSQKQSFRDAEALAKWTWKNYDWQK